MSKPYETLTTQGVHRGGKIDEEPTTNVRAEPAPNPENYDSRKVKPTYQLLHNKEKGQYRVRVWNDEISEEGPADYTEVGRYASHDEFSTAFAKHQDDPAYVVLENTSSGEVYFDQEQNLNGDWTGSGQFDQVTIFRDEEEAATYAKQLQDKHEGTRDAGA